MKKNSLFDDAFGASHFQYLSDFYYSNNSDAIAAAIKPLTADNYTLDDRNRLVEYITGKNTAFSTQDEAQIYLAGGKPKFCVNLRCGVE